MPINTELAKKIWTRYAWARDNGHSKYVEKAEKCDRFFLGDQWDATDKARLELNRRPALTINKILPTVSNIMGEQIQARAETSFRPRAGAPAETADVLNKVYKQIMDNNQMAWKRSDMFADGIITSRGFLDVRIDYTDSMEGEVRIDLMNSKNVIIDPDGEEYDPDTWNEVHTTKWVTADDIAVLYSKEDAELLRNRDQSYFPYGYDSIQAYRDRFGDRFNPMYTGDYDNSSVMRNIRIIDRQYRMLDRQKHFVSKDGDTRPIPEEFDRNRIAMFVDRFGFSVTTKLVRRIRWTVIADNVVLHDDWSPYKHFTIVPFFPHFRRGTTIGLVENLIGSQELLNKVTSQELHVVNTTANSGYKVKAGALSNMTVQELEEKGAQTGLVIEVNGDPDKDVQKIAPNQVPQGLDRISYKAEEHVKTISGVSDSMQGMDRADVAAKAIQQKRQAGSTNLVKPLDNLTRTDYILARNVLDLVQEFYTEERLMTITNNQTTGESETFSINQVTPEGTVVNDLTLGEYDITITSVPARESLEDSQFEQAVAMREAGIALPDSVLIDASRLMNKKDIIKQMQGDQESPEAQMQRELQQRGQAAEVAKAEGEAAQKHADAGLKQAKTQETVVNTQIAAQGEPDDGTGQAELQLKGAQASHEADLKERQFEHDRQVDFMDMGLRREEMANNIQLKQQDMAEKRDMQRVEQARMAAAAVERPTAQTGAPK
jgi:Phage P22-like portal protein